MENSLRSEPDNSGKNDGGWSVIVAIADVAHYIRPGSKLDREAELRGNSVYFPDRVVPMLPEKISNDLCSLREGEERGARRHGLLRARRIPVFSASRRGKRHPINMRDEHDWQSA